MTWMWASLGFVVGIAVVAWMFGEATGPRE